MTKKFLTIILSALLTVTLVTPVETFAKPNDKDDSTEKLSLIEIEQAKDYLRAIGVAEPTIEGLPEEQLKSYVNSTVVSKDSKIYKFTTPSTSSSYILGRTSILESESLIEEISESQYLAETSATTYGNGSNASSNGYLRVSCIVNQNQSNKMRFNLVAYGTWLKPPNFRLSDVLGIGFSYNLVLDNPTSFYSSIIYTKYDYYGNRSSHKRSSTSASNSDNYGKGDWWSLPADLQGNTHIDIQLFTTFNVRASEYNGNVQNYSANAQYAHQKFGLTPSFSFSSGGSMSLSPALTTHYDRLNAVATFDNR